MKRKAPRTGKSKKPSYGRARAKSTQGQKEQSGVTAHSQLSDLSPTLARAIQTATSAIRSGDGRAIIEALEPLRTKLTNESAPAHEAYTALLAYGYAISGKFDLADTLTEEGLNNWSDSLDLEYVRAYTKLSLREHTEAVDSAIAFRRKYELMSESGRDRLDFSFSCSHLSQVCNILASALIELSRLQEADFAFRDAINADSRNHLPHLNLARLLDHQGRREEAATVLAQGIAQATHTKELELMAASFKNRATISACMIVKNEEQMLPGCLDSIRNWVDEIIIVDTGSTDKTVEIAQSYGAKVFHQPWEGNFSKHRNYSLEQATCDWILIIDADERVLTEDVPSLQHLLSRTEYNVLSVSVFNVYGQSGEHATFLPSIRIFRRSTNLRYEGIVHNMLYVPDHHTVARVKARIKHLGYDLSPEKMAKKIERTKTLLEKQLAEDPNNAFAHFNYAQLLRGSREGDRTENIPAVLHSAARAAELTDPHRPRERHIHLMALNQLAWTHFFKKELEKAKEYCDRALALKPNYLDPLLLLGHIYVRGENSEGAYDAYRRYLMEQEKYQPHMETDNIILHHPDSRTSALYGVAMIAGARGESEAAREAFEKIRTISSVYLDTNVRLGQLYLNEGAFERALGLFKFQLEHSADDRTAQFGEATALLQLGEIDTARARFEALLGKDPDNLFVRLQLGEVYLREKNRSKAMEVVSVAVRKHAPEQVIETAMNGIVRTNGTSTGLYEIMAMEGVQSSRLYTEIGNGYFRRGRFDRAEFWFAKAIELDPESGIVSYNLGLTLARLEKYEPALTLLDRFLAVHPESTDIAHVIGDIHFKLKRYKSALPYYEHILGGKQADESALLKLSDCYFHMGFSDSARLGYQKVLQLNPDNSMAQGRLGELLAGVGIPRQS